MVNKTSRYYLSMMVGVLLLGCTQKMDFEKEMIEFVLSDSTLYQDLILEGLRSDFNEVRKGNYEYSVHSLVNSSMIDYDRSDCFSEMDTTGKVVENLKEKGLNKLNHDLNKLSQSDSATVHLFFTERVQNLKGIAVFYRDWKRIPIADIYSDPLSFVWDMNRGRFYLFKFEEGTIKIEGVCKEVIINE